MEIIKHFTRRNTIASILESNEIWLENERMKRMVQNTDVMSSFPPKLAEQIRFRYKIVKSQIKKTGAYVWFTEEDNCRCIEEPGESPRIPIVFNSDDIEAVKWTDMIRRKSWDKQFRKQWDKLESVCRQDDYTKWWVTTKPVSLDKLYDYENQIESLKKMV
jgi:hypothetical protein